MCRSHYVNGGSTKFITQDIIFDGGRNTDNTSGYTGYFTFVNSGTLSIEDGTTVQNFYTTTSTDVKGIDINGSENVTEFTSGANGVFFIGMLDYGAYVIQETRHPEGYSGGSFFYLVVDEDGTEMSDEGFSSMAEANEKAKEVFTTRKTARAEKKKSA